MGIPEQQPLTELLDDFYARTFANGGAADNIFPAKGLEESRKTDIADTFNKFRDTVQRLLESLGIEEPTVVDHMTMYVAVQERCGFESGVKFVHDNAHVTSRERAERQRSVLYNAKTAGL